MRRDKVPSRKQSYPSSSISFPNSFPPQLYTIEKPRPGEERKESKKELYKYKLAIWNYKNASRDWKNINGNKANSILSDNRSEQDVS